MESNISDSTAATDYAAMEDIEILQKIVPIVVPILFTLVIIIGFIGNLLVVLVVLLNKTMRNTTNILILNLAISDLLFIVFCVPFTAADYALTSEWLFGNVWCKLVQFLIYVTVLVSIYTLVFMSIDRFLAVVFPICSISIRTEEKTISAVVLLWVLVLLSCFPLLSAYGLVASSSGENGTVHCVFLDTHPVPGLEGAVWNQVIFQICFFIFGYVLPLLLIIGLYSIMLHRLWRKAPGGRTSEDALRNKRRVVKLITIVIAIFAICWLPIQMILLLKSLKLFQLNILSISLQITSNVLAYANSCVNPILYAFFSPPFRKAFYALIKPKGEEVKPLIHRTRRDNGAREGLETGSMLQTDTSNPLVNSRNELNVKVHLDNSADEVEGESLDNSADEVERESRQLVNSQLVKGAQPDESRLQILADPNKTDYIIIFRNDTSDPKCSQYVAVEECMLRI